jgi:hypothetical protein
MERSPHTKHGKKHTRVYKVWQAMKNRCQNPANTLFKHYGARGIRVCERWQAFLGFYEDMGDPSQGQSIDRIDNDGDYCLENCRWADRQTQANNKRNNRRIEYQGETLTMAEWARKLGLPYDTLMQRLENGWPVEAAFTYPIGTAYHSKKMAFDPSLGKSIAQLVAEWGVSRQRVHQILHAYRAKTIRTGKTKRFVIVPHEEVDRVLREREIPTHIEG